MNIHKQFKNSFVFDQGIATLVLSLFIFLGEPNASLGGEGVSFITFLLNFLTPSEYIIARRYLWVYFHLYIFFTPVFPVKTCSNYIYDWDALTKKRSPQSFWRGKKKGKREYLSPLPRAKVCIHGQRTHIVFHSS